MNDDGPRAGWEEKRERRHTKKTAVGAATQRLRRRGGITKVLHARYVQHTTRPLPAQDGRGVGLRQEKGIGRDACDRQTPNLIVCTFLYRFHSYGGRRGEGGGGGGVIRKRRREKREGERRHSWCLAVEGIDAAPPSFFDLIRPTGEGRREILMN